MSRYSNEGFAGLMILLFLIGCWSIPIGISIYGIYVTFSASVVMGVICCFIGQPIFPLAGVLAMFFHYNLPQHILDFLSKF